MAINLITLEAHGFHLTLAPEAGGSIAALDWRGLPVLRRALMDGLAERDPLSASSFPMVPYAGRIVDGALSWNEVNATIPKNMAGAEHPLHGNGWRSVWRVKEQTPTSIALAFSHQGDVSWPWAFLATQSFTLHADCVEIELSVTSTDPRPFPATLGPHPYFVAQDAVISFDVEALWETSGDALPTGLARPPVIDQLAKGAPAHDLRLDHCFEGWTGPAKISWPTHCVEMTAKVRAPDRDAGCTRIQLYTPEGADFFCLEPVTARPAGFQAADPFALGIVELRMGETLAITTRLKPVAV
jgi:aldose 1-epimerase